MLPHCTHTLKHNSQVQFLETYIYLCVSCWRWQLNLSKIHCTHAPMKCFIWVLCTVTSSATNSGDVVEYGGRCSCGAQYLLQCPMTADMYGGSDTKEHNITCPMKPRYSNGAHLLEGRKYSYPNTWCNGIKVRENMLPFMSIQSKKYPCELMTLFSIVTMFQRVRILGALGRRLHSFICNRKFGKRLYS